MRSTSRGTTSPFSHTPSARVVWSGPPVWGGSEDGVCGPGAAGRRSTHLDDVAVKSSDRPEALICGPGAAGNAVAVADEPEVGFEPLAEELARVAALLLKVQLDQPPSALRHARSDRRVREAFVSLQRVERLVQDLTADAASVDDRAPEDRFSGGGGRGEWVAAGLGH
jgi:hypothetical protein